MQLQRQSLSLENKDKHNDCNRLASFPVLIGKIKEQMICQKHVNCSLHSFVYHLFINMKLSIRGARLCFEYSLTQE